MKQEENLSATNQLIRFIRGGVTCEEFYNQYPEVKPEGRSVMALYAFPALAGLMLILIGYLVLSWQLKAGQSQLDMLSRDLDAGAAGNLSPQDIEARQVFLAGQDALYQDLVGEKLSMSCMLKELSHLSPALVFFTRISLKSLAPVQSGNRSAAGKYLVLEGMAIQAEVSDRKGDFSAFLARLNQSSFFQKMHVNYQRETDTDYGHGLNFILTGNLQ
ncbi:MAG: hypothetical protein AB1611_07080 [bacterium]